MGRLASIVLSALGLIAGSLCMARPMVIHQSQTLFPPSGYPYFGHLVAIDGDWAIVAAATASPTPSSPEQTNDTLLYHRVNGRWTFDRVLERRVSTTYADWAGPAAIAMNNGVAAIGANPTRIFRRTGDTWAEIAHPFTAPLGDPDFVSGDLQWDGNTLLAGRRVCDYYAQEPWGARISRLNADGSWTPLERLHSGEPACGFEPENWGISGNTVVAGTRSNDWESYPDQLRIYRRSGGTWTFTSAIDGGNGEGEVRGAEIFFSANAPDGTRVYRNDDTQTVIDRLPRVNTSYSSNGQTWGFTHTSDVFMQGSDLYRKNDAGRYEHVAVLVPAGRYALAGYGKISGRRVIFEAWAHRTNANPRAMIFDLPATYTPSPVIATGFQDGATPFTPQSGAFTVATRAGGNRVYRQSSLDGEYLALLGNSDWIEQSIEADIRPTAFQSGDRWVGLAVRYQDASNYYYVTLRRSGVVQLKRMRNGAYTTLAERPLTVIPGRSYHVSLHASGSLIMVRLNGKEFVYSDDLEIPRGRAAVLGYRARADYDNVVVAQYGQQPIFDLFHAHCYGPLENMPLWRGSGTGTWNCTGDTGVRTMQQTSTADIARALVGTPTDDQIVTSRARLTATSGQDRWFGVAARYVDASNYYYLTLRTSNTVSLRKLVNGAITELGTAALPVTSNTWYDLRLDVVGDDLRAFVNGVQVLQATDSSHASGQGGILMYKAAAEYTNYYAWQP